MDRYVVERTPPGAGEPPGDQLRDVSRKSAEARTGSRVERDRAECSAADEFRCVSGIGDPERLQERARRGGFPRDRGSPVRTVLGPGTVS